LRIPEWLRVKLPTSKDFCATRSTVDELGLHTVCQGARCPNIFECYSAGTATLLVMGPQCTRNCRFCNIDETAGPEPLDPGEPERAAEAVRRMGLRHAVVTSVTRDDLPDGGATHFAATIRAIRAANPDTTVEVLIPDFQGDDEALATVLAAEPDVLNHNLETSGRLYPLVRPQADYARSLRLLRRAKEMGARVVKSGIMVGLGETDGDVENVLADMAAAGCDVATIGQYMRPSREHLPVRRYVEPEKFEEYARFGEGLGLTVHAAPLVRSSYRAGEFL
jgi:lipoic acid synthetase